MNNELFTINFDLAQDIGHELQRLLPKGSVGAVLGWCNAADTDEPIGVERASIICKALLKSGTLAFRSDDDAKKEMQGQRIFEPPLERPSFSELVRTHLFSQRLEKSARFNVVVTDDASVALRMITWQGWKEGWQAALVFRDMQVGLDALLAELQVGLDWRDRFLPGNAELLFGSGHDGASALVCGRDEAALARFVENLSAECEPYGGLLGISRPSA